jgi:hypothetical protein
MKMLSSCKRSTASARRSTTLAISTFRTCRTGAPPVSQSNNTLGRSRWNSSLITESYVLTVFFAKKEMETQENSALSGYFFF